MSTGLLGSSVALLNAADLNVAPASANAAWEAHNIVATGACDIYLEADPNADAVYEVSQQVDSIPSGGGMVMGALHELTADGAGNNEVRLRINNTSGGTIDAFVTGEESA